MYENEHASIRKLLRLTCMCEDTYSQRYIYITEIYNRVKTVVVEVVYRSLRKSGVYSNKYKAYAQHTYDIHTHSEDGRLASSINIHVLPNLFRNNRSPCRTLGGCDATRNCSSSGYDRICHAALKRNRYQFQIVS